MTKFYLGKDGELMPYDRCCDGNTQITAVLKRLEDKIIALEDQSQKAVFKMVAQEHYVNALVVDLKHIVDCLTRGAMIK